jgi:hypothetical protein
MDKVCHFLSILEALLLICFHQCVHRNTRGAGEGYSVHLVFVLVYTNETCPVKLQLQLQRSVKDREFKGPVHCVRRIVETNGITGLWTGFGGSILFRSNFAWMFAGYEV